MFCQQPFPGNSRGNAFYGKLVFAPPDDDPVHDDIGWPHTGRKFDRKLQVIAIFKLQILGKKQ
jgi:hypothetical protein